MCNFLQENHGIYFACKIFKIYVYNLCTKYDDYCYVRHLKYMCIIYIYKIFSKTNKLYKIFYEICRNCSLKPSHSYRYLYVKSYICIYMYIKNNFYNNAKCIYTYI